MRKPSQRFAAALAASAAVCALATGSSAQTSSASGVQPSAGQVGAQSPADPSAPPPVNGPTDAPSTAPMSGGSTSPGAMSPGAMSPGAATPGSAAPGSTSSGAMTPGGMAGRTGGIVGAQPPASTAAPYTPISPAPGADIVAVLQSSGQFTTLIKALAATNLTSTLQSKGPLTMFAPTDAAFAALPPGTLGTLMQPANLPRLQRILTYHVVAAKVSSAQFVGHTPGKVTTAAQAPITLNGETPPLKVNGTPVIQSDVRASNGTIFVIDKVLMPAG